MEHRRAKWNACGLALFVGILALASPLSGQQKDTGPAGANQADFFDLQRAKDLYKVDKLDQAESICNRLVGNGGTVADQAQDLLAQVKSRRLCLQDAQSVVTLSNRGECSQASEILQGIRSRCPDYPGLRSLAVTVTRCESLSPPASSPPADEGVTSRRGGDLGGAKEQPTKLKRPTPQADRIPKVGAEPGASPRTPQTAQQEDRASAEDGLLEIAIRDYYAGNLLSADQLLEQYVEQPVSHKALAYFYRGAIACTDYFLTGAKDQQKEALARDLFSKARQADRRFKPPDDYVSPKIIEIYEKTAAGS